MKTLISSLVMVCLAATGSATTVTVNASSTGTTTSSAKTSGTITVNNTTNRGYAVFNLAAAGIPANASVTSVKLVFTYSITGSGVPPCNIYGYTGDLSALSAAALCSAAITTNNLYTASWGTADTTKTMISTAAADTFIQHNLSNTISTSWVESASSRVYTITGGASAQLQITYACIAPAAISGATAVCTGASTTLVDTTVGGVWSSGNTSLATVSTSGIVTGIAQGVVTISYNKTGCPAIQLMSVKTTPAAISGAANICLGATTSLTNSAVLGSWSSANPSVASVDLASGLVRGVSAGTTTITYSTGCGADVTKTENVIIAPAAITGTTSVCRTATTTLADATTDGSWSSSNSAIASVSASGIVTGMAQGTATITYGIAGCISVTSYLVKQAPAPIVGAAALCNGTSSLLTNTAIAGTWSTANAAIASVNASGLVFAVAQGNVIISYSTGCGSDATKAVAVELVPTALVGTTTTCLTSTTTVTEAVSGGTWSSSNAAIATVSNAGVVSGVSAGMVIISYTLTNSCGTNTVIHNMNIAQVGLWLGGSSTGWNDAANWACATLPGANTDVVIPSGTTFLPALSDTADVYSLTVDAGATITIGAGAFISVGGNYTNNGAINGAGAIIMRGTAAQIIYGIGTTNMLTINNTHGVSVNAGDTVRIVTDLTLTNGNLTTNSGIKLLSTVSGTGRIAPITGGAITGNVVVEQYFDGGRRAFRFFGHPFSTAIPLSMMGTAIDITGNGGVVNGFTTTASNAASCFRYNPLTGNSALPYDPGWKPFTNANSTTDTNAFAQYEGVRLFIRGAKGEGLGYAPYTPSPVTISMMGQVNTGNQTITLHKGMNSDYNQISNPYPSPTDIGEVIATAQAAGQVAGAGYYVWNPFLGVAGAYELKIIGGSYILDQNSSFQVRAIADGSTLSFTESNKAANGDETLLRTAPAQYISLKVYDAANHPWDMMYLSFNDNATDREDTKYDATKAMNPDLNFYSLSGITKFSIDARPYNTTTVIPLGFTTNYQQQYTIKAENMVLPAGATLFLHDKMLNQYVLLQQGTEYSFNITSDKATQGENRFELTANKGTATTTAVSGLNVAMSPNPATDNVTIAYTTDAKANTTVNVMNVTGATLITKTIGNDASGKVTIALNGLPAGIYMVEVMSGDNRKVQQLIKE